MSDTVIYPARKIITMNPRRPVASHVAVRDGHILGAGDLEELSGWGPSEIDARFASRWEAMDGLIGAAHALHTVAIILTMAEPRDLGRSVSDGAARWAVRQDGHGSSLEAGPGERADPQAVDDFSPCVFLYDNYPGGVGLSEPLYAERQRLMADARALIAGCDCERGCPGCIGPVTANEQRTDAKAGAKPDDEADQTDGDPAEVTAEEADGADGEPAEGEGGDTDADVNPRALLRLLNSVK